LTGATGFLGRTVAARAEAWQLEVKPASREVFGLACAREFADFLDKVRPDYAIDAAGVLPRRGDVTANVAITRSWIKALDHARCTPRLVLVGSSAIYGSGAARNRATRKDDPKRPVSDYGRAKLAALELGCEAHECAGHDIQTAIVFNLMGEGQPGHLVPRIFIERALNAHGGSYRVGPIDAVRDFMDVEDAADALIAMALHGATGEFLNVATGLPTRIRDLVDAIDARTRAKWVSGAEGTGDGEICYGDPARLAARIGWRPRYNFETALARIIKSAMANRKAKAEA
jgi:nucleoside-diphosphate-sugar epimerase